MTFKLSNEQDTSRAVIVGSNYAELIEHKPVDHLDKKKNLVKYSLLYFLTFSQ